MAARVHDGWWMQALAGLLLRALHLLGMLPPRLATLLVTPPAAVWAGYWLLADRRGRKRRGYHRNVRIATRAGGAMPALPRGHLWRWSMHMAQLVVDFCQLHRLTRENVRTVVDFSEAKDLEALYAEGRGVIAATGHIGSFDTGGYAMALAGIAITSVYRPSPVPAIDRAILEQRGAAGQRLLARKGAMRGLQAALHEGHMVALIVDGGSRGSAVFTPFLGTMAASTASPAVLQLQTGAPIAVVTCERTGPFRYRMKVWDVIRASPAPDRDAAVLALTARVNEGLGRAIAAAPDQWFWQGNRWSHRPPGEVQGPEGLPPLASAPPA
ncbi:MAG: hypothetical protein RL148_170 [Planctomycetota bacterium]|jgi:KDO2-lipid IV(A) lauroyltransferase